MSVSNLLSPVAKQSIAVAKELEINQDNIEHYFLFLDNLKLFLQKHAADQVKLIDFFYDLSVYQLIHEKNTVVGCNNPLLELMQDLSKFKDAIPKDQASWLYEPSRVALVEALRLAKNIVCVVPRNTLATKKVAFQEKIISLSYSLKAAAAVVQNPFAPQYQQVLQLNVDSMRVIHAGKTANHVHEHPKQNAFAAALEIISGVALMFIAALMTLFCPVLGVANAILGATYATEGTKRLFMVNDAWAFHNKKDRRVAEQSVKVGAAFYALADRPASLFYKNKAATKTVSYPEVELQQPQFALAR